MHYPILFFFNFIPYPDFFSLFVMPQVKEEAKNFINILSVLALAKMAHLPTFRKAYFYNLTSDKSPLTMLKLYTLTNLIRKLYAYQN